LSTFKSIKKVTFLGVILGLLPFVVTTTIVHLLTPPIAWSWHLLEILGFIWTLVLLVKILIADTTEIELEGKGVSSRHCFGRATIDWVDICEASLAEKKGTGKRTIRIAKLKSEIACVTIPLHFIAEEEESIILNAMKGNLGGTLKLI
jgi:hypothetical protein